MKNPNSFYKAQLELHQQASKSIYKQMGLYSVLRLTVFLLAGFGVYLTYQNWQIATVIYQRKMIFMLVLL